MVVPAVNILAKEARGDLGISLPARTAIPAKIIERVKKPAPAPKCCPSISAAHLKRR